MVPPLDDDKESKKAVVHSFKNMYQEDMQEAVVQGVYRIGEGRANVYQIITLKNVNLHSLMVTGTVYGALRG